MSKTYDLFVFGREEGYWVERPAADDWSDHRVRVLRAATPDEVKSCLVVRRLGGVMHYPGDIDAGKD